MGRQGMNAKVIVKKDDLATVLRRLGIADGDTVMVHSSLSRFGHVDGGAETVIAAFLEVLGPRGNLVMPTLCQKDRERRFDTWNIETSPSDVGKITEVFRLRPDSIRSDHATHSVAAAGPLAAEITKGHAAASGRPGPWGDAAFALGSPWQKLYDLNATVVLLGVDLKVNTMVHFIEHLIAERALNRVSQDRRTEVEDRLHGWCKPGVWPSYDRTKLQEEIERLGLISRAQCGNALLMAVPTRPMVDHAIAAMEAAPRDWFDSSFCHWYEQEEN